MDGGIIVYTPTGIKVGRQMDGLKELSYQQALALVLGIRKVHFILILICLC